MFHLIPSGLDGRDRKLTLCCVPRFLFRALKCFFGERKFQTTNSSCSLCGLLIRCIDLTIVIS